MHRTLSTPSYEEMPVSTLILFEKWAGQILWVCGRPIRCSSRKPHRGGDLLRAGIEIDLGGRDGSVADGLLDDAYGYPTVREGGDEQGTTRVGGRVDPSAFIEGPEKGDEGRAAKPCIRLGLNEGPTSRPLRGRYAARTR